MPVADAEARVVAALYDIHGNLPALEAVLEEVERERPDLVVVGGDVVSGPFPLEVLDRLLSIERPIRFVRGNADRLVVELMDRGAGDRRAEDMDAYAAAVLPRRARDALASWPETFRCEIAGLGVVVFCHGSPRADDDVITVQTPDERLREFLADVEAQVVVCGHTHMQFDRPLGSIRMVNPGSVGMPYGEAGGHWALFGPAIALRRSPYSLEEAAAAIRTSDWSGAQEFADENVLARPSVEEALAAFETAG